MHLQSLPALVFQTTFALLLSVGLLEHRIHAEDPKTATITWVVKVPDGTPASSQLFMAGNVEALGPWQPNAYALQRVDPSHFRGSLQLPIGTRLEYKFTRGSWASGEKSLEGAEIANRTLNVTGDQEIAVTVAAWANAKTIRKSSGTGDLRWKNVSSQLLQGERRVTVWLPPQYRSEPQRHFPVVYFLDGQNVFDTARSAFGNEWKADEAASNLAVAKPNNSPIVVAIDNSPQRMQEYTPAKHTLNKQVVGGDADTYLRFLCEEIKPWIDTTFRTQSEPSSTTLVGSSLGALMVLHALRTRPDVFGNGIAMSPSLFWGDFAIENSYAAWAKEPHVTPGKLRLWIDMGTQEGKSDRGRQELLDAMQRLEKIIHDSMGERIELEIMIDPEGEHNEAAWARRLPNALNAVLESQTP